MCAVKCFVVAALLITGCSKSIRPDNSQSRGNAVTHDMSGNYSGLGSWTANGQAVDQSAAGKCIVPDLNKPGVLYSQLPAKIFVSDDSKGHITVNFLKNVNGADGIALYPGPRVVHYVTRDLGDHAEDSLGNYYYDYASKALRVHFNLPGSGGPCTTRESFFSVTLSGGMYIYSTVGTWDFAGSPD